MTDNIQAILTDVLRETANSHEVLGAAVRNCGNRHEEERRNETRLSSELVPTLGLPHVGG